MVLNLSTTYERQQMLEEMKSRPPVPPPEIGVFTGLGKEIANAPFRAYGKLVSPFLDDDTQLWRTDPSTMGIAAHLIEGLSDYAPYGVGLSLTGKVLSWSPEPISKATGYVLQALPYAAAALYGVASKRKESSKLHQYQGVEKSTADELGTYEAATLTGALALPVSLPFKSLLGRSLSGGGINIVAGAVDRGIASHVLKRDGYHEMAEHYKVFDGEAMLLDGMIGSFFGLIHTKEGADVANKIKGKIGEVLGDLADGISDRFIYRHANVESSVGIHKNYEAHHAHKDLHAETIADLVAGKKPTLNEEKLNKVIQGTMEDPGTKTVFEILPDEPHSKRATEYKPHLEEKYKGGHQQGIENLEELNAQKLLKKLEADNPEGAKQVQNAVKDHVEFNKLAKEKRLHEVLIQCFIDHGGS